jgi:hypothetical protein
MIQLNRQKIVFLSVILSDRELSCNAHKPLTERAFLIFKQPDILRENDKQFVFFYILPLGRLATTDKNIETITSKTVISKFVLSMLPIQH